MSDSGERNLSVKSRIVKILAGLFVIVAAVLLLLGGRHWLDQRRIEIGASQTFRMRLPARPPMRAGLKSLTLNIENPNNAAVEVVFRLYRAALGKIGKTYQWDWESPLHPLAGTSWINQGMCVRQDGSATAWDVDVARAGNLRLKIWRDLGDRWVVAAQSALAAARPGLNHFVLNPPLPVKAGNVIGFYAAEGGVKLNSTLGIRLPGELHQHLWNYLGSAERNIQYLAGGDVNVCLKAEAEHAPDPGFAMRVEMSPLIVPDKVGALEGAASGGGGTPAISIIDFAKIVPRDGALTGWEVFSRTSGQARLKVWRREGTSWKVVAESPLERLEAGTNFFSLKSAIEVRQNDCLGYYSDQATGELPLQSFANAGKNPGKLYVMGEDVRGPLEENRMTRDSAGNYAFCAVYAPMIPGGEIRATGLIQPGRSDYRLELPDLVYAIGEEVELSLDLCGGQNIFLYPAARYRAGGGKLYAGLKYDAQPAACPLARVVRSHSEWPAGDLFFLGVGMIGIWGLCRTRSDRRLLILMLLLPLAALLAWNRMIPAVALSRLLISLICLGFLPGFIVLELIFPKLARELEGLERLPLIFGFTCGLWTVLALFAYRLQWLNDGVVAGVLLADLVGLLSILCLRWNCVAEILPNVQTKRPYQMLCKATLLLMVAAVAVFIGYDSQYQRNGMDTFFHLACCRRIAEGMKIIGGDALMGPGHGAFVHYASNPWYLAFGLTARLAHADITLLYVVFAGILTGLFIFVFYAVIKLLVRDSRVAVVGVLLGIMPWIYAWAVQWRLFKSSYLAFLPYPYSIVELILFPMVTIYALRVLTLNGNQARLALLMLSIAAMGQHICYVIYTPFVVGVVLLIDLLWPRDKRDRLQALLLTLAVLFSAGVIGYATISFPLVGKGLTPESIEQAIVFWREHAGGVWQIGRRLFAASPWHYFIKIGWQELFGFGIILLFAGYGIKLICWKRANLGIVGLSYSTHYRLTPLRLYLGVAAVLLGTWAVVFNPILLPCLVHFFHSSIPVYRWVDVNVVMSHALFAGAVACVFSLTLIGVPWRRFGFIQWLIPLLCVLLAIGLPLRSQALRTVLIDSFDNRVWHPSMLDLPNETLYEGLRRLPPAVVAVRPDFAELVAAFTPHYVVTLKGIRIGDYKNIADHLPDNEAILDCSTPPDEMRRLLAKHNCRYVVVPLGDPKIVRFENAKDLFGEAFRTESHAVFEVRPGDANTNAKTERGGECL